MAYRRSRGRKSGSNRGGYGRRRSRSRTVRGRSTGRAQTVRLVIQQAPAPAMGGVVVGGGQMRALTPMSPARKAMF